MPLSGESHVISPNSTAVTIECATNSLYVLADANTWEESMSTSVPALLRSTTETEYLAPENTPASAADAWAVRSRSGWAGAGTAALNMLRDADLGTNPAGPRLVGETFVGGAVIGDTAVGGVDRGTGPGRTG